MTSSYLSGQRKRVRFFITVLTLAAIFTGTAFTSGAATAAPLSPDTKVTTSSSTAIYKTFQSMLKKKNGLPAADIFLESNIKKVTKHHATLMVLQLENARLKALTSMTDRLLVPNVQDKLLKAYQTNDSITKLMGRTQDSDLRVLLKEARDSGYRLVMLEGSLYPIMNYAALVKYTSDITEDISSYIMIMTKETKNLPADDGALVIGYQEILLRALSQERFLELHPKSNRAKQVQDLLNSYTLYTFYGLNNTPLFDYDTNKMVANAQRGYNGVLQRLVSIDSEFLTKLDAFMDVVKEAKYEKTVAVEKWLEQNVPTGADAGY